MSSEAEPINPARFAAALTSLELPSLHAKAAEIRNSMAHMRYSNEQLQPFADEGDKVCEDAISENKVVLDRMRQRIDLLRAEVEGRGMMWLEEEQQMKLAQRTEDQGSDAISNGAPRINGHGGSGSLNDDELARRLAERMAENEEDGVHL